MLREACALFAFLVAPGLSALRGLQPPATCVTSLSVEHLQAWPDAQHVQVGATWRTQGERMHRAAVLGRQGAWPGSAR